MGPGNIANANRTDINADKFSGTSDLPDHSTHTLSNADMAANLRHVCGQTYP